MDEPFARARLASLLEGPDRPRVEERARALERRVHALPERAMRRAVLREALVDLHVPDLVALLAISHERGRHGRGDSRELLQELALEPTVFHELTYPVVHQSYALASDAGLPGVAALFLSARGQPNPTVEQAFQGNEHLDHPVGIRRAWARGADRDRLDRLVHDRDWRVITLLLDNPRVVERDVVRIAAMRPTRPEVLELVATHRRWASRYVVRKALALNPSTPAPIVRRLLPTLMRQDLRAGLQAGCLDPELQAEARRLLAAGRAPG